MPQIHLICPPRLEAWPRTISVGLGSPGTILGFEETSIKDDLLGCMHELMLWFALVDEESEGACITNLA
jgi:hypothetical protein